MKATIQLSLALLVNLILVLPCFAQATPLTAPKPAMEFDVTTLWKYNDGAPNFRVTNAANNGAGECEFTWQPVGFPWGQPFPFTQPGLISPRLSETHAWDPVAAAWHPKAKKVDVFYAFNNPASTDAYLRNVLYQNMLVAGALFKSGFDEEAKMDRTHVPNPMGNTLVKKVVLDQETDWSIGFTTGVAAQAGNYVRRDLISDYRHQNQFTTLHTRNTDIKKWDGNTYLENIDVYRNSLIDTIFLQHNHYQMWEKKAQATIWGEIEYYPFTDSTVQDPYAGMKSMKIDLSAAAIGLHSIVADYDELGQISGLLYNGIEIDLGLPAWELIYANEVQGINTVLSYIDVLRATQSNTWWQTHLQPELTEYGYMIHFDIMPKSIASLLVPGTGQANVPGSGGDNGNDGGGGDDPPF